MILTTWWMSIGLVYLECLWHCVMVIRCHLGFFLFLQRYCTFAISLTLCAPLFTSNRLMISRAVFPVNLTFNCTFESSEKKNATHKSGYKHVSYTFVWSALQLLANSCYVFISYLTIYYHSFNRLHTRSTFANVTALLALFSRAIPLTQSNDENYYFIYLFARIFIRVFTSRENKEHLPNEIIKSSGCQIC